MSCGETHDKVTRFSSIAVPIGLYLNQWPVLSCSLVSLGILANLIVSPDMDIKNSKPVWKWRKKRLDWIWRPYWESFHHRGNFFRRNFWTHCPVIGTFSRWWPLLLLLLLAPEYSTVLLPICIGLVIGDTFHLLSDLCQSYLGILE